MSFFLLTLQFFVLDVVINSTCLSVDNIYTQLKRIYMAAEEGVRGSRDNIPRVGLLTAGQRDHWAIARSKLLEGMKYYQMFIVS